MFVLNTTAAYHMAYDIYSRLPGNFVQSILKLLHLTLHCAVHTLYYTYTPHSHYIYLQVDLEDYVARPDRISGADINAVCQEAGMHAVRENR